MKITMELLSETNVLHGCYDSLYYSSCTYTAPEIKQPKCALGSVCVYVCVRTRACGVHV